MELIWEQLEDDDDNYYYEANSPYVDDDTHFRWRLRQRLTRNRIVWYADHYEELGNDSEGLEWLNLEVAKEEVQEAHNRILQSEELIEYEDRDEKQLKER
jgi:hypothetical protein